MNAVKVLVGVVLLFLVWWGFMVFKSSNEEARIRSQYNIGERFFDYFEQTLATSQEAKERVLSLDEKVSTSVEVIMDISPFLDDISKHDPFKSIRLFDVRDYHVIRIGIKVAVYKGVVPSLRASGDSDWAPTLRYDPTNGVYSGGFQFRVSRP
jgi:hypothetical protein